MVRYSRLVPPISVDIPQLLYLCNRQELIGLVDKGRVHVHLVVVLWLARRLALSRQSGLMEPAVKDLAA